MVMFIPWPALAQDDKYSFRLRGMGTGLHGFIDDLYSDLSLNPAYIQRYQGNWLYTNLSNLQGGKDESVFGEQTSLLENSDIIPNNLIGNITNRFGSPFGIFVETRGRNLTSDNLTVNEQFNTATSGTVSRSFQMFDTDNSSQSFSFIGMVHGIGLGFSVHRNESKLKFEDENTANSFVVLNPDTEPVRSNTASITETTTRSFKFPNSSVGLSVGKIFREDNREISLSAGLRPERMAFNGNEVLSLLKDSFLSGIADKFDILDNQDIGFLEMGLKSTYAGIRLTNIHPSVTQLQQNSYLINYTRYTLPFDVETVEKSVSDSLDVSGVNRKNVISTKNGVSLANGDGILNRVEVGAGVERHFNELNTLFGIGVKVDYIWGDFDIDFNPGRIQENLDINVEIDDPAAESESFQRIISDNKKGTVKNNISGAFVSFPIGIETRIKDKLTLRVGARSIIPINFNSELISEEIDDTDELIETTEDITTFVPEDGFGSTTSTTINEDGKTLNSTSYHFGASYQFNDALTVDLLHFSKLTELDTWWLSVVLKY